jgi:hypothetical protein
VSAAPSVAEAETVRVPVTLPAVSADGAVGWVEMVITGVGGGASSLHPANDMASASAITVIRLKRFIIFIGIFSK